CSLQCGSEGRRLVCGRKQLQFGRQLHGTVCLTPDASRRSAHGLPVSRSNDGMVVSFPPSATPGGLQASLLVRLFASPVGAMARSALRRRSAVPAQATVWFALIVLVLVLMIGVLADGGLLFATYRRAALLADSAASAGAGMLDPAAVRADPAGPPR